jgi:uncharacterized membrane protein/protein-disulfide isomerase
MFIAGVLTIASIMGREVPCGPSSGCATVEASEYSHIGPIPVAILGFVGYALMFALAFFRGQSAGAGNPKLIKAGFAVGLIGFLSSMYYTYVSLYVLHATCVWCLSSAAVMTLAFVMHALLSNSGKPVEEDREVSIWGGMSAVLAITAIFVFLGISKAGQVTIKTVDPSKLGEMQRLFAPGRSMGDAKAKVVLVEFNDVNCPLCRRSDEGVRRLVKSFGGKLRWDIHQFPQEGLKGHETSLLAASLLMYAEKEGKFWALYDRMMMEQNTEVIKSKEGLIELARQSGMSVEKASEAIESPTEDVRKSLTEELNLAEAVEAPGTPTFILYGEGVDLKMVSVEALERTLRSAPYRDLMSR